jgi:polar amino acid transport system substrate-binding protein
MLFTSGLAASNHTPEPLNVGIIEFPPYYTCSNGISGGGYTELIKRVLTHSQLPYTIKCYPPKRLYLKLANGEVDLFMGLRQTEEYKGHVIASLQTIRNIELRVYALDPDKLPQSKAEWPGNSFVIIDGYNYGGLINHLEKLKKNNEIILHRSAKHLYALRMLESNRADLLLDYKEVIDELIDEEHLVNLHSKKIIGLNLHFIVSKKTPEAHAILKKMESSYDELYAEEKKRRDN